MKPNIVFSKTPLGQAAIEQRNSALTRSLRLALILVDGHSDINQLRLKAISLKNLENDLEQLALQGYIRTDNPEWQALADNNARQASATPQSALQTSPIKAKLIDAAIIVLGDEAHKIIRILHEAPDHLPGLEKAIERCKKLVDLTIDESRADELKKICQRIILSER